MASYTTQVDAVIANGASSSAELDCGGRVVCGIQMPAVWTAANLTFLVSTTSGGTYQEMYRADGSEYVVAAAAGTYIPLPPLDFAGIRYIKIQSGVSGTLVNQGAARTLTVSLKDI